MNRNNERHFNQIPEMHASRTRFNRDQIILTTFDAGKLIPFFADEVLPGDTFNVDTAAIIRMTTPKYPVMDDAFIDFYYFFCPNRILWDNFKHFMGEVEDTPWMPAKTYAVPQIEINGTNAKPAPDEKSILDYLGVPTKIKKPFSINALPIRAYVKIWNEFFRDENVDNAATLKTDDANVTYTMSTGSADTMEKELQEAVTGGNLLPVNKFHDYFTSCLPYPQRGPEVTVPTLGNAPVYYGGQEKLFSAKELGELGLIEAEWEDSRHAITKNTMYTTNGGFRAAGPSLRATRSLNNEEDEKPARVLIGQYNAGVSTFVPLAANLSEATAATINDLRKAISVQQYYEALARGGSRYREQVRAIWDVTISDKTVQVPEYLGGGRYHVNINQIVQTSGQQTSNDTPIGETGAMSVTPINESSFTKSFEEHGFVIGVACVRHNRSYQQGLERFWSRKDRLDYYVPQFANLGEQPVKKKEIMLTGDTTDEETFGYQEAWADYRMKPNRVSGLMRSNAEGTLDFWHYADNYSAVPTLSQEWMAEGKEEIARTLIVQDEPQFFGAIRVANKTTRRMPLYSVPGLYKL
nr:MAG TPA: Major capsid protein [Microviridae sp.]